MKVKATIVCKAVYDTELEIPDEFKEVIEEYIAGNIADLEMENLRFLEDVSDDDCLISYEIVG